VRNHRFLKIEGITQPRNKLCKELVWKISAKETGEKEIAYANIP
jgi:hypothetical protein